jgi:hypothetical protein
VYPPDVVSRAAIRHADLLAVNAVGSLTIRSDVDAWRALREFGQEVLEAAAQTE